MGEKHRERFTAKQTLTIIWRGLMGAFLIAGIFLASFGLVIGLICALWA